LKKIIVLTLLFLFSFVPAIFAHSHLEVSTPEDGEVITENIDSITLTFDGNVEQGSTIELFGPDGQTVPIEEIIVTDTEVIGKISNELENGNYRVVWSIISADGHQMEGEFSFEINVPETETPVDPNDQENPEVETEKDDKGNQNDEEKQEIDQNEEFGHQAEDEGSSNLIPIVIVMLILAIMIIFFALRRKK
jgi:copper resistance protein C